MQSENSMEQFVMFFKGCYILQKLIAIGIQVNNYYIQELKEKDNSLSSASTRTLLFNNFYNIFRTKDNVIRQINSKDVQCIQKNQGKTVKIMQTFNKGIHTRLIKNLKSQMREKQNSSLAIDIFASTLLKDINFQYIKI